MGIQGLLKGLQGYSEKSNIRRFSNQAIAIDASSWLHKSVYSISEKYVESSERSKTELDASSVRVATIYMQKRCQELFSSANIAKLYLVFDGKRCPLKAATNDDREERRRKNLKEARQYRKQGRRDKAEEKYKMCIKIHDAFSEAVADALQKVFVRDNRLKCIFSPYEADAQLARLCVDRIADAIITEDSDVLVYSASCHVSIPIIYKLDRQTGDCDLLSMDWLIHPTDLNRPAASAKKNSGALDSVLQSLADRQRKRPGLGTRLFVQACILAGSDYSPSKLNGVGLVTAFKLLRDNAHRPCNDRFRYVLDGLTKKNKGSQDIEAYETLLAQSEAVFYHHPVLNDNSQLEFLTPLRSFTPTVDGQYDYRPQVDRFGDDLWFLGHVDECRGRSLKLPDTPISQKTQFPVKEIVLAVDNGTRERVQDVPTKRRRVDDDKGASEAARLMLSVKNPYNKSARSPFEDIGNTKTRTNPFESYSFAKPHQRKDDGYAAYVHHRSDLRFTKRKFNEDGKPVNPNYKVNTCDLVKPAVLRPSSETVGVKSRNTKCNLGTRSLPQSVAIDPPVNKVFDSRADEDVNTIERGYRNALIDSSGEVSQGFANNIVASRVVEAQCLSRESKALSASFTIIDDPSKFEMNPVDLYEPDERNAVPASFKSDSFVSGRYDSLPGQHIEFDTRDSGPENESTREIYCLPEGDCVQSHCFVRTTMNARRVTLESPDLPLDELECTGTYVNLELSSVKWQDKPSSPGDLSEVGMCEGGASDVLSSFFKSDSLVGDRCDSLLLQQDSEFGTRVPCPERESSHEFYSLPEGDCVQSRYFVRTAVNPRRVTLATPEQPRDEFESTGTYVNLELSSVKRQDKPSSPGDQSVLSEVDEMLAAAIPLQSSIPWSQQPKYTASHEIDFVSDGASTGSRSFQRRVGALASTSTPFQNNFNPIQRHSSRPSSRTGFQSNRYGVLAKANVAQSLGKRIAKSFIQKTESKNRITSYFGYQSVVADSIGDDGNFLGL